MNIIERTVVGICHAVLWISTSAIFAILAVNTVLRYGTGASLQWANEVPELLFPWMVTAGVVLAAQRGSHITTTFLVEKLSVATRRLVGTAGWLVVGGLYGTLAAATLRMLPIVHDEKSAILQVPGSLTYGCVMGGMTLLSLLALQSAWRSWHVHDAAQAALVAHDPVPHW
jgi:TRAP-type C4-dicarboxylate transport system permease small subunit